LTSLKAFINRFRAQPKAQACCRAGLKKLERMERIEVPPEEKPFIFLFRNLAPSDAWLRKPKTWAKAWRQQVLVA